MVKLPQLTDLLAEELNETPAAMKVLGMMLRKDGLIPSTGRGVRGAEMVPSAVTNLTLGALGGGYATKATSTVKLLRSTEVIAYRFGSKEDDPPPIPAYERLGRMHDLGQAFDELIVDFVNRDLPLSGTDLPLVNMGFSLERSPSSWAAVFWFDSSSNRSWRVVYIQMRPDVDDFERARFGGRRTQEDIDMSFFSSVADCLR